MHLKQRYMLWKMKLKLDISLWHSSNEVHCNTMPQYLGASRGVFDTVIVWMDIHSEGGLSHPTIHQGTALDLLHRTPWIYCTESTIHKNSRHRRANCPVLHWKILTPERPCVCRIVKCKFRQKVNCPPLSIESGWFICSQGTVLT